MSSVLEQHLSGIITTMERRIERPETPVQAVNLSFTGTEFGYEWVNGKPHAAVNSLLACGERHHYNLVPVPLQEVIDSQ